MMMLLTVLRTPSEVNYTISLLRVLAMMSIRDALLTIRGKMSLLRISLLSSLVMQLLLLEKEMAEYFKVHLVIESSLTLQTTVVKG